MTIQVSSKTEKKANVKFKSNSVPHHKKPFSQKQILEPNSKKTFAFGSSTPRELSHINSVLRNSRFIDTNKKNLITNNDNEQKHNLSYYMRQARSITPNFINCKLFFFIIKVKKFFIIILY